jgi:hypothetical protein
MELHSDSLDAVTRRAIADTVPVPYMMPSAPFSRDTALWLCRACSHWNLPAVTTCRCHTVRP